MMKRSRAILIGPLLKKVPEARRLLKKINFKKSDLRIGVDGGTLTWVRLGLTPDFAVGDWDSLKNKKILKNIPHESLPCEKDRSDLCCAIQKAQKFSKNIYSADAQKSNQLSVKYASAQQSPWSSLKQFHRFNVQSLFCLGVTGGRLDHHLATLYELSRASQLGFSQVEAIDEQARYIFLSNKNPSWSARLRRGQIVSVFAIGGVARGVRIEGCQYSLPKGVLTPSSCGLSNEALGGLCAIRIRSGRVCVMVLERP